MRQSIGQKITLNTGAMMPGYGFGCYKAEGDALVAAIGDALADGYRLLDTAYYYGNEADVGRALKKWPKAKEAFVVSKIWPTDFDKPVEALERSLRLLGRERLDAFLLHWPGLDRTLRLRAFEALLGQQEKGVIGVLGVSNFLAAHLEEVHDQFGLWAPINQIEVHPYFPQTALCQFCAAHHIAVMAWSPLGRGREMSDPVLDGIATSLGKTPAQIILRWHVQHDRVPIPKSVHAERIRENAAVFDFSLDEAQMRAIDGLGRADGRVGPDPAVFPPLE